MITYAASKEWEGREYTVSVGHELLTSKVKYTGDWYEYKTFRIGTVNLKDSEKYTLTIKPESSSKDYLMYFKSIQLITIDK